MNTGKKIILGIIIVIVGFFGIGIASIGIWSQVDPEGYSKMQEENEKREAEELAKVQREEQARARYFVDPSQFGVGDNYDKAEEKLRNLVLNYKGSDNSGWTMSELLLVEFAEECGVKLYLEQYGFSVDSWIRDYSEEQVDMVVWIKNNAGDLCSALSFEIYVGPHTGRILGGDETGQNVLKLLDDVSERIILGEGSSPLYVPDDVSIDDLKSLIHDLEN